MIAEACVFDMDGTLLNTLEDLADCANAAIAEYGFQPHPVGDYRLLVGGGARNLITRALPENARSETQITACLSSFKTLYDQRWAQRTHLYDGVKEALNQVTGAGLRVAVLTNKPQAFADLCVDRFLGAWTWDIVQGQQDGLPVKPAKAISDRVTNALQVSPDRILYLGDSDVDMHTARNAGYKAIGVTWGFRSEQELREAGAEQIIHHPDEISGLLPRS